MKILAALGLVLASSTPLPATPTADMSVDIVGFNSAVHTPGTDLSVSLELTNPSSEAVTARVSLGVQSSVPIARATLTEWMDGSDLFLSQVATEDLELQPGTRTYSVTVDAASIPWGNTMDSWGPRGLEASVSIDSQSATDRSLLVIAPSYELTPMDFTTIVPVTTGSDDLSTIPSIRDMVRQNIDSGNTDFLAEAAQRAARRLAPAIRALSVDGISLALDSALASTELGTLGFTEDALTSFGGNKRDILLLPAFDANLSQWSTQALDSAFTPQVEAMTASQNDLAEADISARTDVLIPPDGLTANAADRATDLGMRLVVGSDKDSPVAENLYWTPTAVTTLGQTWPLTGVLSDSSMNEVLAAPAKSAGDQLDKRQLLLAMSAVHYRERPNDPRPFVLQLVRDSHVAPAEMTSIVSALNDAPWLEATDLSTIASSPVGTIEREPLVHKSTVEARISPVDLHNAVEVGHTIDSFALVTNDPRAYTGPVHTLITSLVSHAWFSGPVARFPGTGGLSALNTQLSEAITAQESSTINIISQATELPVRINSMLPTEANVQVRLTSSDRRLQFTPTDVTLAPETTTTVMVPVKAVGSGNVSVTIDVVNDAGAPVGRSAEIDIRVRADWENVGTAVLAGAFLVILVFGIIRSAKKGTRTRPMDESVAEKERMRGE